MADSMNDSAERTEDATPKKREDTRNKGMVAKSMEINSALVIFFGLLLLQVASGGVMQHIMSVSKLLFGQAASIQINTTNIQQFASSEILSFLMAIGPLLLGFLIIGLIGSASQAGFHFSVQALEPKWNKFNPVSALKSTFVSKRSMVEMIKNLLKVVLVGWVAYYSISSSVEDSVELIDGDVGNIVSFLISAVMHAGLKIGLAFVVLAAFDYLYQRYEFEQQIKMTKEEVKEETKMQEGDPQIKGRVRSIQRQIAYKRMMQDVPKADVVVTNPTHFAVALKYDAPKMQAPTVVAKGADLVAQRIKAIAAEHNIPVVEDKMLARTLFKSVDVGEQIPEKLFQAVAQVLAYIYRMKNSRKQLAMN
ncbi:MAG TPA: flagellar biosynthesis protein FlhB [Bacteroidota bacterium]|nr:flagellar biosynthesis protein FlhB [Bacteroidota bacterium]